MNYVEQIVSLEIYYPGAFPFYESLFRLQYDPRLQFPLSRSQLQPGKDPNVDRYRFGFYVESPLI